MTPDPTFEHAGGIELASTLARFAPATPALLDSRQLLRRSDTKFLATPRAIAAIVEQLTADYAVVPVGTGHLASYANLYFDTADLQCFHDHRRGRRIRHKIRIRHYRDRRLAFLEVKTRRNELHTDKARMSVAYGTSTLDADMIEFLLRRCPFGRAIAPAVEIDYRRIMLAGIATNERVTIDLGVSVDDDDGLALGAVAIVEVKQPSRSLTTPIMRTLREAGCRPCSLSKYITALTSRVGTRGSRLRPSLRQLERIVHP